MALTLCGFWHISERKINRNRDQNLMASFSVESSFEMINERYATHFIIIKFL